MIGLFRKLAIFGLILRLVTPTTAASADSDTVNLLDGYPQRSQTNAVADSSPEALAKSPNAALREAEEALATTNLLSRSMMNSARGDQTTSVEEWWKRLEIARGQRRQRLHDEAAPTLVEVILANTLQDLKRTALLELALLEQERNNLSRAQQIFAHYLAKWPNDESTPEVILRQGLILRQMGLYNLALTKFYAVMTSSLVLEADKFEYYQRMVVQAQTEIAETFSQQGKFQDAAEFFARLLKQDSPLLNRPQIHFKLVRSLSALGRFDQVVFHASDFLGRYDKSVEQPEVRFYLATALKRLGRRDEALQQVMLLLRDQKAGALEHPEIWSYWQQRTGNDIANQLYKDGDYLGALAVYTRLSSLSINVEWQLPVWYQLGLTYERLQQPNQALGRYAQILERQSEVATNSSPNLRTVLELARWRQQYLGWQTNAETVTREFKSARVTETEKATLNP